MQYLRQSTAFTETVGPILDSAGVEYTGAVIGDLSLSKNGTEAAMAAAATLTHVSNGYYTLVGTTGNSDTLGRATIRCNKSTYQMPPREFTVLHANVYDVMFGSTAPSTHTAAAVQTLVAAGAVASVTGNVGGNVVGSVGSVAAGGITAASIATDAIDADAIAASAVTEIQSGLATAAALATVDTVVDGIDTKIGATTYGSLTADIFFGNSALVGIDTKVDTIDNLIDTEIAALTTAVADLPTNAELATALSPIATASALTTVGDNVLTVDTVVDAIKAKTDSLTFTVAGKVDSNVQRWADSVTVQAGFSGSAFYPAVYVSFLQTDVVTSSAIAASAVTEIQSGLATAAALTTIDDFLDTEVAAIKAKTDQLTFTVAGQVDANAESINGVTVLGAGTSGNKWRA